MSLRKGWREDRRREEARSAAAGRSGAALQRRRRGRGAARERERRREGEEGEEREREWRREGEEGAERRLNGPQTCRPTNRAGPVLVPRAASPAQARPGAWHGHGTSPNGHRPGRSRAVLSRAVPVLAQRARPSWPPIARAHGGVFFIFVFFKKKLQKYIFGFRFYNFIPLPPGRGPPPGRGR